MPRVTSSVIDWVGYDPASRTLKVLFKEGRRYSYLGVPETLYRNLLAAPSIGEFYNAYIKEHYPYHRH